VTRRPVFATLRDELDDACHAELSRLVAAFLQERTDELGQLKAGCKS